MAAWTRRLHRNLPRMEPLSAGRKLAATVALPAGGLVRAANVQELIRQTFFGGLALAEHFGRVRALSRCAHHDALGYPIAEQKKNVGPEMMPCSPPQWWLILGAVLTWT